MYYDSFGWHTEAEYADFVAGYGFDVREWLLHRPPEHPRTADGHVALAKCRTNPCAAEEIDKRVQTYTRVVLAETGRLSRRLFAGG